MERSCVIATNSELFQTFFAELKHDDKLTDQSAIIQVRRYSHFWFDRDDAVRWCLVVTFVHSEQQRHTLSISSLHLFVPTAAYASIQIRRS